MPMELPESINQLLTLRAYGHVVTRNPDGSPQMSMVWMDVDGNEVLFNTVEGRVKPRNLRRDPRILISVQNPSTLKRTQSSTGLRLSPLREPASTLTCSPSVFLEWTSIPGAGQVRSAYGPA